MKETKFIKFQGNKLNKVILTLGIITLNLSANPNYQNIKTIPEKLNYSKTYENSFMSCEPDGTKVYISSLEYSIQQF